MALARDGAGGGLEAWINEVEEVGALMYIIATP